MNKTIINFVFHYQVMILFQEQENIKKKKNPLNLKGTEEHEYSFREGNDLVPSNIAPFVRPRFHCRA